MTDRRRPPTERRELTLLERRRADDEPAGRWTRDRRAPDPLTSPSRAVSTTLDYTLTLAIATVVITVLFVGVSDFVDGQRERVVRTELSVVGQRIASDVTAADRLVEAGHGNTDVRVNQSLPRRITGADYNVHVTRDGSVQWVNLTTRTPDVEVAVRVHTETPLAESDINGGDVSVVYDESADELEVRP
jgi:hypothetical protein